ncbi:MAG: peptide ABC transporter substrate-binding protein [Syntrophothermus sp.]
MSVRRNLLLVMALVAVLAFGSAGMAFAAAAKPAKNQTLTFNDGTEPETLDPNKSTGIPEAIIEINLFDGLTRLDKTDRPVAAIAKSWEISKDGLEYTFHLRDAKWSNGDPVTAYDFEYSWKRALAPETASEYAYQLYYIKNGEEYNTGKIKDANEVGVKAVDAKTLKVTLRAPTAYFLSLVAFPTYLPLNKKAVEAGGDTWYTKPETLVSNGPFKLAKWAHQDRIELVKNPTYWDAKNVKLDKLVMYMVEAESTELTMFETGQLDLGHYPPRPEMPRLIAEKKVKFTPYLGTYYYFLNVNKPPFDNPKVRRAFALAINRKQIVEKVSKAGELPAMAWVPYGIPDAKPGTDFRKVGGEYFKDNDVETARKLLAEAGYPDGKGLPPIEILYNTNENHKAIAEAIQEMWKKALGANVTITNQEWKVYLQSRDEGRYQVARAGWIGDYVDPMTFIDMMMTDNGNNDSFWGDKKYDELVKVAQTTTDPKKRYKAMHDAEKILMDAMPLIPIYFYTNPVLQKDYVKDVIMSMLGFYDFKYAWIAQH